ncbi:MAG TPA: diguanylate cyclase, partial [Ktedonobacteraceae bacterium]|nr:diguanylate cyclase [Ktedonobacteraceae bacterium]
MTEFPGISTNVCCFRGYGAQRVFNPFSQIEFYREDAQLKEVAWRSIDEQVSLAKSTQKMLACALFDIDHFGPIVRSCGSETGRLILSECLTRIQEESGQVMSYGRDEFVIVQSVKGVEDAMFS